MQRFKYNIDYNNTEMPSKKISKKKGGKRYASIQSNNTNEHKSRYKRKATKSRMEHAKKRKQFRKANLKRFAKKKVVGVASPQKDNLVECEMCKGPIKNIKKAKNIKLEHFYHDFCYPYFKAPTQLIQMKASIKWNDEYKKAMRKGIESIQAVKMAAKARYRFLKRVK